MSDDARRANGSVRWRLVWVVITLIGFAAGIEILTVLFLTAPTASGGGGRPGLSSALSGRANPAACASTNADPVASSRAGATSTLVPPGGTSIHLCRYGPDGRLVLKRSITSAATVSRLTWELNALLSTKRAHACPSDDGESVTVHFKYPSGAENPVRVGLSGCQTASNGHVSLVGLDQPVIQQIAGLVPWVGTIEGRIQTCGGSLPARCTTVSPTLCANRKCLSPDRVAIEHAKGEQYPDLTVQHQRFSVQVEPGRYRLVLLGGRSHVRPRRLDTVSVLVRSGKVSRVRLRGPLP